MTKRPQGEPTLDIRSIKAQFDALFPNSSSVSVEDFGMPDTLPMVPEGTLLRKFADFKPIDLNTFDPSKEANDDH